MSPPIYYGGDRLSLSGIDKVYYGSDLVYSQNEGPDYLKFTATQNGSTVGIVNTSNQPDIQVNVNGTGWEDWDYSTIDLDNGEWVEMRGDNPTGFSKSSSKRSKFKMTGTINGSGNIMTLIDMTGETDTILRTYCFYSAFNGCTSLVSPPDLPAVNIAENCYNGMFSGCTSLVSPPDLPAPVLKSQCYENMFYNDTALTSAPIISARLLNTRSCMWMLKGCSSIRICDTAEEGATAFFTCPSKSGMTQPVQEMFANTGGTYTADPLSGNTYYYY